MIISFTNLSSLMERTGRLKWSHRFSSGNYELIEETTERYSVPGWLNRVLFVLVVLWQMTGTALFFAAGLSGMFATGTSRLVVPAYTLGLSLFGGFMLSVEFFRAYDKETTHVLVFACLLLSLLITITL